MIVSGSSDCKIKVWNASTGECLRTLAGHDLLVRALSFDPWSGRLVSASYDKTVKVWDLGSGKCVCPTMIPLILMADVSFSLGWCGSLEGVTRVISLMSNLMPGGSSGSPFIV